MYADAARRLSDFSRRLVPTSRDHDGGDYLREALLATREAERLLALAVVVERASGTTWETIGDTAEGITRQSAQKKWADTAVMVTALAEGIPTGALRSRGVSTAAGLAEDLDVWYVRHRRPGDIDDDAERPISGYLLDPGPAPDLSAYDTGPDEAYEWLLSDHPWARVERLRRAESGWDDELRNAATVRDWTDRMQSTDRRERYPHNPEIAENLRGLADLMRPIADDQQLRAHLDAAVPDDVRVQQLRARWVTHQHAQGQDDYRYPEHLLGLGAAAYPPPVSGSGRSSGTEDDR
ncbi:hypothetical protein AFB00_30670 (plasmid) [Pseudonocardia sp. HH130630-07]|nr:hypothetical protein AFB00_30670 [Pseudonocardia sp. HH130630-07]